MSAWLFKLFKIGGGGGQQDMVSSLRLFTPLSCFLPLFYASPINSLSKIIPKMLLEIINFRVFSPPIK